MAETPVDESAPTQRLVTSAGVAPADPDALAPGTRVARYRIEELIGRGGMGEVYRAEQLEPVRRTVALKLLHQHRIDARQLGYFEVERQILARMQHPAIAQIFDAGTTPEGAPWFAMEFIQGEPLNRYCEAHELGLRARIELFVRVCEGVQHAHQKGVIHRDLKPQNILVVELDGRPTPKIIDFGIATAASRTVAAGGEVAGTPAYMSPEQAGLAPYEVDIRSDVYSLGVVLYELLSGHRPEAASGDTDSQRTLRKPPSRALETLPDAEVEELAHHLGVSRTELRQQLRRDLDWIVMQAIRPDRDERYASAAAFADDLRRFLEDRPVRAAPGGRLYVARKFVRRHRLGIVAGSIALAALLSGLGMSLYGLWQADAQRQVAEARSRELEQVAAFQQSMLEGIDIEAMGRGLLEAQRAQIEVAAKKPGADPQALAAYDRLVAQTTPADLARGVLDRHVLARALDALDRDFASQPRLDADLRLSVANVYQAIGGYARAAEVLPAVVETRRRELGPDAPATMEAELELGTALSWSGKLPEARKLQESLRERAERLPALSDELREKIELDLALTLSDQGEIARAIEVQQGLLERQLKRLPESDPAVLKVRNNLAISLMRAGRRDEGRAQFETVLRIRRETLGAEHEDTVATMGNVAASRGMSGDLEGALALQEEVYAVRRRQLGDDHPLTLGDRGNLGSTLSNMGRLEEAREHLEASLEGRRRLLGPTHPQTLRSLLNLGAVMSRLEKHDEALKLQQEAFEARRTSLGAEHPDTLNSKVNVATTLRDADRPAEGLPLAREALAARQRVLGPIHPDTIGTYGAVSSIEWDMGNRAQAIATMEAAMAVPGLPERLAISTAARLYAMRRKTGDATGAAELRTRWIDPFLQKDPATLQGPDRGLRVEVLREIENPDGKGAAP